MNITRHFARRFRLLVLLRTGLAAGGLYNLVLATLLVAAPGALLRTLELSAPRDLAHQPVYLWILALPLAMLAWLYLAAARDPRRHSVIILVAIVGRAATATAVGTWAALRPELAGLWPLAGIDAGLGIVHAATWLPLRT